jgi:hypothetical protein
MKIAKSLLLALSLLVLTSLVYAQPALVGLAYTNEYAGNQPLGTPCTEGRAAFADGTPVCIFWDRNLNGPDLADQQPPRGSGYGEVNFNSFSMNGVEVVGADGYFMTMEYWLIGDVPTPPNDPPVYYLRINYGGVCWTSDTFRVVEGPQDLVFLYSQWHCDPHPCGGTGDVPDAPDSVRATDDSLCLAMVVRWTCSDTTANGFNIYAAREGDTVLAASAGIADRSKYFAWLSDRQYSFFVRAFNCVGESPPSTGDNGSTYLVRFASGASGNISGVNWRNQAFTLHFAHGVDNCPYGVKLYLLRHNVSGGWDRGPLIYSDSLIVETRNAQFPNDTTDNRCLRLLLRDSSFVYSTIYTDTTDSSFSLGHVLCPTGAVDIVGGLLPDHFGLAQNFPNPFNPETAIRFSVPMTAAVRVDVYNLMGQLVRTLTDRTFSVGTYEVAWDSRDNAGRLVSAGIYLCRMEAPGFVETRKMLLLK